MLTVKPSDFRPAYKNQVDFDHPHKNEVKVNAHSKTMSFSARTQRPNQFWFPRLKSSQFGSIN